MYVYINKLISIKNNFACSLNHHKRNKFFVGSEIFLSANYFIAINLIK